MDNIPSIIGHSVVEIYNLTSNYIDSAYLQLRINEDKIHQIIRIPKTGIDLSIVINECEEDNEIIVQWKQQHPNVTKLQQTLCELIEASEVADEMFVLNFITLFMNTFIEKNSYEVLQTRIRMKMATIED